MLAEILLRNWFSDHKLLIDACHAKQLIKGDSSMSVLYLRAFHLHKCCWYAKYCPVSVYGLLHTPDLSGRPILVPCMAQCRSVHHSISWSQSFNQLTTGANLMQSSIHWWLWQKSGHSFTSLVCSGGHSQRTVAPSSGLTSVHWWSTQVPNQITSMTNLLYKWPGMSPMVNNVSLSPVRDEPYALYLLPQACHLGCHFFRHSGFPMQMYDVYVTQRCCMDDVYRGFCHELRNWSSAWFHALTWLWQIPPLICLMLLTTSHKACNITRLSAAFLCATV